MLSNLEVIAGYYENNYDKNFQNEIINRLAAEKVNDGCQFSLELCVYQLRHPTKVPFDVPMWVHRRAVKSLERGII